MSNIVSTKAKDGSTVEFNYEDPKQGGVKDVYFAPDKSYVVAFYRDPLDSTGLSRLEKLVGKYREQIFDSEGGEYWKDIFCWPEKIVEYDGRTGIVVPAYKSHFFFQTDPFLQGAEKEGKWFASAKNYNRFIPQEEKGSLNTFIRICLRLAQGVRRLHAAGLAHSDLSYKNCLVDPQSGSACIIDLDGLVVPGLYPPDVLGTPDFIAPEVIESLDKPKDQRILPSRKTDQHALAVLIYQYLFHRHPLRGRKVWSPDDKTQESLEMGKNALFIEHPTNHENAYDDREPQDVKALAPWCHVDKLSYKSMGSELSELFERAFIDGLHNPDLRPTANEWEDALRLTADRFVPCANPQCVGKGFIHNNTGRPSCPYCGTRLNEPHPFLDFYVTNPQGDYKPEKNRRMVLWHGARLFQWHADRYIVSNEKTKPVDRQAVAYSVLHKGVWKLVNVNLPGLKVIFENKQRIDRKVEIGQSVILTNEMQLLLKSPPNGRAVAVRLSDK